MRGTRVHRDAKKARRFEEKVRHFSMQYAEVVQVYSLERLGFTGVAFCLPTHARSCFRLSAPATVVGTRAYKVHRRRAVYAFVYIGAYTLKGARLGSFFYAHSHRCFSGSRRSMHSRVQSRDCLDVLLARRSVQGGDNRRHFRARSEGRHRNAASVHV